MAEKLSKPYQGCSKTSANVGECLYLFVKVGGISVDGGDVGEDVGGSRCLSDESAGKDGKNGYGLHF